MPEPVTRVPLFVPGRPQSESAWQAALKPTGLRIERGALRAAALESVVRVEWIPNDGTFGQAFSFGTVPEDGVRAIAAAGSALVLHLTVSLREGLHESTGVVQRLREAGALAVRLEQSRLGWEIADWLAFMTADDPRKRYRAAVVALEGEGVLQSCGMHAFSMPDVQIQVESGQEDAMRELASTFNAYQLAEDPLLISGQTFSPDPDTPRRVVQRWPDTGYPAGHACHNPYGVWRLGPPGGRGRPQSELVPAFMPTLVATLTALEGKAGKPLTRPQVEAARDKHPCMAMKHRDLQALERSRGYADIDPELVWEQWQLVRQRDG